MSLEKQLKHYGVFKVKPVWRVLTPSSLIGTPSLTKDLYGVDRGGLDVVRNWEKISSVEQFNQGWADHPTDYTITIAIKTKGTPFEILRRLSAGKEMFDIELDILMDSASKPVGSHRPDEATALGLPTGWVPWMVGFESYLGCVVQREGRTIEIGGLPVQEFECSFLHREIRPLEDYYGYTTSAIEEGDGTTPSIDLSEINL